MAPDLPTVGFVVDDLGHGGAQKQLVLLAEALRPRFATRVYALSPVDAPHGPRLRARGVPVTAFPRRSGLDFERLQGLTRALAADRVDVVHGFLDASDIYAFLAGRRIGKPVVLSLQSDRLQLKGARGRVLRWMHRHADAVTVNSEAGRDYLVERVRVARDSVHVVRNIADVFAGPRGGEPTPPVVGCVGRLVALKRFDAAVRALPEVRAQVPGTRLELVGDGPAREELRALSASLGVGDAVAFAGAVDDATPLIARMSCLVLPSAFEGLPNAALEAMGCGIPVVASPVGDLASIIVDGSTGVVVRDTAPATLAAGIVRALTDRSLRERSRQDGPRAIRERFSPEVPLSVLIPLYDRLCKRTGAAALKATTPVLGE
ncbi:MAG TPA: glycosyltransferase family 4 protein [Candidatus Krumholzibacteria bacterium]|nr:glycosyltransferase family 4 protein [Candidatus Krumholzibacteria bacterium]